MYNSIQRGHWMVRCQLLRGYGLIINKELLTVLSYVVEQLQVFTLFPRKLRFHIS